MAQPHELSIDGVEFALLKTMLDEQIQKTVRQMKEKHLDEGSVSAKIKIEITESMDENGEFHYTALFEPKVTSRIGSSFEDKVGATGGRITVQDDGTVIMGQISMDEVLGEQKGA